MRRAERRSFLLYGDHEDAIGMLTDKQAGQLLRILYSFGLRGEEPGPETDGTVRLIFCMMRPQMLRDREAWASRAAGGSDGGRPGEGPENETAAGAVEAWADATGYRKLTKSVRATLAKMVSVYGAADVEAAIQEAVLRGHAELDYVQGILRNRHEERRLIQEARDLTPESGEDELREALTPLLRRWGARTLYRALSKAGDGPMTAEELTARLEMAARREEHASQR